VLNQGTRRFDLYDFFSVFLPGAALLLGLFPFLPEGTDVFGIGLVLPMVIAGFVAGRAIHAVAIDLEEHMTSHREAFISELESPCNVSEDTVDAFYTECRTFFPQLDLAEDRSAVENKDEVFESIYGLVRSYIHMDSRGRSRTFQAVFAFYRSMLIVSILLILVYILYTGILAANLSSGVASYTTFLGSLQISPTVLVSGIFVVATGLYLTFRNVLSDYRGYFVQYLISDFIIIRSDQKEQTEAFDRRDQESQTEATLRKDKEEQNQPLTESN